jgi:hypothetical protein
LPASLFRSFPKQALLHLPPHLSVHSSIGSTRPLLLCQVHPSGPHTVSFWSHPVSPSRLLFLYRLIHLIHMSSRFGRCHPSGPHAVSFWSISSTQSTTPSISLLSHPPGPYVFLFWKISSIWSTRGLLLVNLIHSVHYSFYFFAISSTWSIRLLVLENIVQHQQNVQAAYFYLNSLKKFF